MDKAFNFLKEHADVALATVDGDKPEIRVFQIMRIQGRDLYFATAPHKKIYSQLRANANVGILCMHANISVRISGKAVFDVEDAICKAIYRENPVLSRLYESYADLVYFRVPVTELDWFDLTPTPPEQKHITYEQN